MRKAIAGGMAAMLWACPAVAHPHVWIDVKSSFVVAGGRITAIRETWRFDSFYSASLLGDFDKNHDRIFEADEILDLEKGAFSLTARQGYFTHVKANGRDVATGPAANFSARVDGDSVVYSFALPLLKPVDPRVLAFSVTYYEGSYYVDVTPGEKDGVSFLGDGSLACTSVVAPDPGTTIYFGEVHPLSVSLHCKPGA